MHLPKKILFVSIFLLIGDKNIMDMKKFLVIASVLFFTVGQVNAKDAWINNLRTDFLNHSTVIYAVNLRNFNAQDTNKSGVIDFDEGEESGTFLNAIARLDELQANGITALHLLPITPVGKTKALGTAGSLYSAAGFNSLNPQLKSDKTMLSIEDQARKFINEAHERGISVIVDVPACGSYDLYLQRPELFIKDKSGQPVIPADWTDVRLFNSGTETVINRDVFNVYREFVDFMMDLGVDGIRADVAHSKPAKFWKELIEYSRQRDPQILWLAESSNSWKDSVSEYTVYTPYDKLLQAGFDGYYGSYFNMKNWKTSKDLISQAELDFNLEKTFGVPKSVIGSFTTHDELSPILVNGEKYSKMIMWLNATLPVNSYYIDGFDTADKYIYFWANKKAQKTNTDDDFYFVHRGKIDIFNFSAKPGGKNIELQNDFRRSNEFKKYVDSLYAAGRFKSLKTSNPSVFAYAVSGNKNTVVVIGNMNFRSTEDAVVRVPKFNTELDVVPIVFESAPVTGNGKFSVDLMPGEIQVFQIGNYELK